MSDKICFLILAHDRFDQLNRLVQALQHPGFDLYIHVDASSGPAHIDPQLAVTVPPIAVNWAGFTQVAAIMKLMRTAVADDTAYRYYVLISGTDYPIASNDQIYRAYSQATAQYMHCFSNPDAFWHNRYRKFHFMDMHPLPRRLIHMVGFRTQGWLFPNRKLPLPLTVHFGHTWWSFTSDAMQYIIKYLEENPAYTQFFRYSHAADEMFFQTILANSPFGNQIEANLNYTDWSAGGSHPKILGEEDLDKLKESPCLFARKFAMSENPKVLDRIDKELRGQ